jgi:membrane protease YdiL (CAAX protease family)
LIARRWIVAADGTLRAPWRLLVFLGAVAVCVPVATSVVVPAVARMYSLLGIGVSAAGWGWMVGLLAAHFVALRLVDRRPWSDVLLDGSAARVGMLARGLAIGALAIGIPILLLVGLGWLQRLARPDGSWIGAALRASVFLLPAAFFEELTTRGYVFALLRQSLGPGWALAATSVAFGLLHLQNAGASVQSVSIVVLAGFFLGGVLLATRSLYAAWMAHFAWNWTMAVLFHTAVSGLVLESPDYRYVDAGPDWATGGDWGPEGGAAGGLGMIGGLTYLYARQRRRREDS